MTPARPPASDPRDRLPVWVIVLLCVFLALRVAGLSGSGRVVRSGRVSAQSGQPDEKTIKALVSCNLEAKNAYLSSFDLASSGSDGPLALPPKDLHAALKSAEALQTGTRNQPGAARRVIVLRALLRLPLLGAGPNGLDPAQAFAPAALAKMTAPERAGYAAEGRVWADVARGVRLSPAQTAADAALLRQAPNIRWWLAPSLSVLYGSQNNPRLARHYAAAARSQAILTLGPLLILYLVFGALGLFGVGLLIAFFLRLFRRRAEAGSEPEAPSFWPTLRETVPFAERRLRAGDLMGIFVVYLLMEDIIGWLVGGFGIRRVFYYPGLMQPYLPYLRTLSASDRVAANVVLSAAAYLISAAVPVAMLLILAAKKRASIADELGFSTHRLGWNLLYGVGGYGVALPLSLLAGSLGSHIPGPTPSNPAIPMLAGAGSVWSQATLVGLATLAAPLTEEFLFRGVFYNAAKLRVGVWPAIVLTGLIFGFVHPVGLGSMLPLAVLGGVFAWMAETRKSLIPGMVGHFLQNSMATLLLLLALGS